MAQKFIGLEDAAKQLGGTKDQLNALREAGRLRGYRDGASWKFRTEEIDEIVASGGLAAAAADSGIDQLDMMGGLNDDPIDLSDDLELDLGSLDLDDDKIDKADQPAIELSPESDLELSSVDEPTTPADEEDAAAAGDDELVLDTEPSSSDAESILLTDDSLGGVSDRPPSTIIGKSEAGLQDADLELAHDSGAGPAMSDVKLASDDQDDLSGLSDLGEAAAADASKKFEGLEELEIDLEAESSRILESKDLEAARAAAGAGSDAVADDDQLEIDALDSDLSLATGSDAASLTGLSQLGGDESGGFELAPESSIAGPNQDAAETDPGKERPGSSAVLSEDADDDFVLGGEGSDVTHSSADSGINLAPADSGIALDDASLDLSGAGSSLDLSESFGAAMSDGDDDSMAPAEAAGDQDFLLQPVADESDLEDSSQIIALEEVVEEEEDDVMIGDDVGAFDMSGAAGAATAAAPVGVVASVEETQFDLWAMLFLTTAVLSMFLCAVMSVDMIQTIWSWNEPTSISSSILESVAGLWGYDS